MPDLSCCRAHTFPSAKATQLPICAFAMAPPSTIDLPAPSLQPKWNTKNLGLRLAADCASAAAAASMVAPLIAIVDRSVASGLGSPPSGSGGGGVVCMLANVFPLPGRLWKTHPAVRPWANLCAPP